MRFDCGNCNDYADYSIMLTIHPQLGSLLRAANYSSLRHQVLSRNLANVNTPNYQREDVEMAEPSPASSAGPQDLSTSGLRIVKVDSPSMRSDGNNVDIDAEIGAIQQNAMAYQTVTQLMSSHLDSMRRAIRGS